MKKFNLEVRPSKVFANPEDSSVVNKTPYNGSYPDRWYWALDEDTGILYQVCDSNDTYLLSPAEMVLHELT